MSCNWKIKTFLCIVAVTFYELRVCASLNVDKINTLGFLPESRDKVENDYLQNAPKTPQHAPGGGVIARGSSLPEDDRAALPKRLSQFLRFHGKPLNLEHADNHEQKASEFSWTFGNVSRERSRRASDEQSGYQAGFPGFHGAQEGSIYSPWFDAGPQSSEWWAMRPWVQCDDNSMTFAASGLGYSQLFVYREGDSPISVFHLTPNCGYLVSATWNGLVVMAAYGGCYMTQENGNHVLPMLWRDSPLNISCPIQKTTPSPALTHSAPLMLCSPYGAAVHIYGTEGDIPMLGTIVKGDWALLVSAECAGRIDSPPGQLLLFVPFTAPCLAEKGGFNLQVLLNEQEYSLSCPKDTSIFPHFPSPPLTQPLFPVDPTTQAPPQHPQYPDGLFYPGSLSTPSPTVPTTDHYPLGSYYPDAVPLACPPYVHGNCIYYPYPPHYHPYPPHYYPHPTMTTPPTSAVPHSTARPATTLSPTRPLLPHPPTPSTVQCLGDQMIAFLPYAHLDSIQIRADPRKSWQPLSAVSLHCKYMLQRADEPGLIFHSPIPACHSRQKTLMTVSLWLRFWDVSVLEDRILELLCPHQPPTDAPPTTASATTASTTHAPASTAPVPRPRVFCAQHQITVVLPSCPISAVTVKDAQGNQVNFEDVPKHCGYSSTIEGDGSVILNFPFTLNCYTILKGKEYIINIVYMTANGKKKALLSCPVPIPVSEHECKIPREQRLPCGSSPLSQRRCLSIGCCFSTQPPTCYYPMDECTLDRHFVFSVPASLTEPPLSPALLVVAGNASCTPEKVDPNYALFKIPMDGCGTRRLVLGKTLVYIVEIVNVVMSLTLNYGTITRDSPIRLLIECRYMPDSLVTVGYMVKNPSLGPDIQAQGVFGVQLRIAKDDQYNSYYPQYHQPLQMLLGKDLYLEVRLVNPPEPKLVLLVHFCVAYPRSGQAMWVLLYKGCPNPYDPTAQNAILSSPENQTRRFTFTTFQFLQEEKDYDLDEEIYFMCSTEACLPQDGPCVEGCFGQ